MSLNISNFEFKLTDFNDLNNEEIITINSIKKNLRSSLSKSRRNKRTLQDMENRRRRINFLENKHLMLLDLHNSKINIDCRNLSILNLGLSHNISENNEYLQYLKEKYENDLLNQKELYKKIENEKRNNLEEEIKNLKLKFKKKKKELNNLELKNQNNYEKYIQHQNKNQQYELFNQWINLNKELDEINQEIKNNQIVEQKNLNENDNNNNSNYSFFGPFNSKKKENLNNLQPKKSFFS